MGSTYPTIRKLKRNDGLLLGPTTAAGGPTTLESTKDGTLVVPIEDSDRIGFYVEWETTVAARTGRFVIKAGDKWQKDVGNAVFSIATTAGDLKYAAVLGPFEAARFAKASTYSTNHATVGQNVLVMDFIGHKTTGTSTHASTATCKSATAKVVTFQMPGVVYDS